MKKLVVLGFFSMIMLCSFTVFANKTAVTVTAPEKVEKGTEITIKLEVKHIGNTKGHHTDWVWLKINGEEVKRWEYSKEKLPKDQNFTVEYKIKADSNLEIIAEGHCNRHGSKGEDKVTVTVQ